MRKLFDVHPDLNDGIREVTVGYNKNGLFIEFQDKQGLFNHSSVQDNELSFFTIPGNAGSGCATNEVKDPVVNEEDEVKKWGESYLLYVKDAPAPIKLNDVKLIFEDQIARFVSRDGLNEWYPMTNIYKIKSYEPH